MAVELPRDVYPLLTEMRRSFEKIMTILQEDERRIRKGYELFQQERDAMGRDIVAWHRNRGCPPWEKSAAGEQMPRAGPQCSVASPPPRPCTEEEGEEGPSDLFTDNGCSGGRTEVSLPTPRAGLSKVGKAEEEHEGPRASASAGLARVPTNPPSHSTTASHSYDLVGDDDGRVCRGPAEEDGAAALERRYNGGSAFDAGIAATPPPPPHSRDALVSPTKAAPSAPYRPDADDDSAFQDELRLYSVSVKPRSPREEKEKRRPTARVAVDPTSWGPLHRPRSHGHEDGGCTQGALLGCDHTAVALSHSPYSRGQEAEQRLIEQFRHKVQDGDDGSLGALTHACNASYAAKHAQRRTRDAATATVNAGLYRRALAVGNTDASHGFWINVWPCFGTFSATVKPTRVYVYAHYRHMEDVIERAADMAHCKPAPQCFFQPDGQAVRLLQQLVPEQHYLLFPSGGFYRQDAVPSALLREIVKAARHTLTERSS